MTVAVGTQKTGNIRVKCFEENLRKISSTMHTQLPRKAYKDKMSAAQTKQNLQRKACRNSGISFLLINQSELQSVINPRATGASNQASKDVPSGLDGCLDILEDHEGRRRRPFVL